METTVRCLGSHIPGDGYRESQRRGEGSTKCCTRKCVNDTVGLVHWQPQPTAALLRWLLNKYRTMSLTSMILKEEGFKSNLKSGEGISFTYLDWELFSHRVIRGRKLAPVSVGLGEGKGWRRGPGSGF